MRILDFRDLTLIEACVHAPGQDRAAELFQLYFQTHGGDLDTIRWLDRSLEDLGEAGQSMVRVSQLDGDGLVISDARGRWVFVTPLSDGKQAAEP